MPIALRAAYVLWAVFLVSWMAAGAWAARTAARPGRGREAPYLVINTLGWMLMFIPAGTRGIPALWVDPPELQWALVGAIAAGFAFCWWARLHLGKLWSGNVTRKEGHRVVDTGPYRLVRHPIYTGLILSAVAMAALSTTPAAIAGFVLFSCGFWIKARLEERFLSEELGAEAYAAYKARTPMLVPFLPTQGR